MNERIMPAFVTDNETETKYELDFSHESVAWAERRGFKIADVGDFPATMVPDLFYYAFRMHHRSLPREKVDKLREKWGGVPEKLLGRLIELYVQAQTTYSVQTDEDAEKNSSVTLEL